MIKPAVLDAMVAAGCTAEQIAAAVKADQASSSGAERQARYRARKASQSDERDVTSVTVTDTVSPKKETSPTPPKEKTTPSPVSEPDGSSTGIAREFSEFWSLFPNKVGKRDAETAFIAARKRATFDAIMAGLRSYVAKTDDRPWCNPGTFLRQDRWADQPASSPPRQQSHSPPRKPNAFDAFAEISRMKGWTDEPDSLSGNHEDAERLFAVGGEHSGSVVDLRRGHDWHTGSGDR